MYRPSQLSLPHPSYGSKRPPSARKILCERFVGACPIQSTRAGPGSRSHASLYTPYFDRFSLAYRAMLPCPTTISAGMMYHRSS